MFRTALIALDHSAAQGPLIDCLSDLRNMGVARVILAHVVRLGYGQGAEYANREALEAWLAARAAPLREAGLDVEIDIRAAGDVAADILQAAADHGADLIVIGSRGQTMLRGLFLGSVAREVIRKSTLPVRLEWIEVNGAEACERACHAGLRRMLLASDFSPHARAAEAAATMLAPRAGVVDIVHVISPAEAGRYTRWQVMARAALDNLAHEIEAAGGKAERHLAEGKPSEQIARLAAERDADLIVVGKHGANWVESMVIGSTAAALCEIARRPVLMVPLRKTDG
ncbi:MAG: universal stress protein [Pararhodobacter sp.]|nr:universal stress protein [Pararhodobacter sp.]